MATLRQQAEEYIAEQVYSNSNHEVSAQNIRNSHAKNLDYTDAKVKEVADNLTTTNSQLATIGSKVGGIGIDASLAKQELGEKNITKIFEVAEGTTNSISETFFGFGGSKGSTLYVTISGGSGWSSHPIYVYGKNASGSSVQILKAYSSGAKTITIDADYSDFSAKFSNITGSVTINMKMTTVKSSMDANITSLQTRVATTESGISTLNTNVATLQTTSATKTEVNALQENLSIVGETHKLGTIYKGKFDASGANKSQMGYLDFFSVESGSTVVLNVAEDLTIRIAEYSTNAESGYIKDSGAYAHMTSYVVSNNTKYIRMSASYSARGFSKDNPIAITDYQDGDLEILKSAVKGLTATNKRIDNNETSINSLQTRITTVEGAVGVGDDDIVKQNNPSEMLNKLKLLTTPLRRGSAYTAPKPISFLHITDIHTNSTNNLVNLTRVLQFKTAYSEYIDDIISTGDQIYNSSEEGFSHWSGVSGAENILLTTGNHECNNAEGTIKAPQSDVHDIFFAPFISNWITKGATFPTDYATNKTNYFYKDYSRTGSAETNVLRVIFLDAMYPTEAQTIWLEGILADALTNGYSVICCEHFPPDGSIATKVKCSFSTMKDLSAKDITFNRAYNILLDWVALVQTNFINSGGKFVCWLCGHIHADMVAKYNDYPNQIFIAGNCAASAFSNSRGNDTIRTGGTRFRDSFNIVSVDTYVGLLRLQKVGANIDRHLRKIDSLCYNYITHEFIEDAF